MDEEVKNNFEKFKRTSISNKELEEARKKSFNLKDKANDFLLLIDMAKDAMAGKFKIQTKDLLILIAGIIYVISPIDAIPDFIIGLGWVDDLTVICFVL